MCDPTNEYTKLLKQWRERLNLRRTGTLKVGKIVERILEGGDHREEFQRDIGLYIISTCIIESINADSFFTMSSGMETKLHQIFWRTIHRKEMQRPMGPNSNPFGQLMQLNEEIKMKRSSLESMEEERQLTGSNIRTWFIKKRKSIPNLLYRPIALRQPQSNHVHNKFKKAQHADQQMNTPNSSSNGGHSGILIEHAHQKDGRPSKRILKRVCADIITICIIRSINGSCFFITLKSLMDSNKEAKMKRSSIEIIKGVQGNLVQNVEVEENLQYKDPMIQLSRILKTIEQDVYAMLALLMDLLEVQGASACEPTKEYTKHLKQWRIRWNLGRTGTQKVGKMVKKNSRKRRPWRRIPKRLYVAHNFHMHCLEYEWRLFIPNIDVCYLNTTHFTTGTVDKRNKDEKEFHGEYRRGKAINRVDYKTISHESEINLQEKLTHMAPENQEHTKPSVSMNGPLPAPEQPCLECGSGRESLIAGPNDLIEEK
ncbi:hypothetical protein Cgig2_028164 [Carnegiea gigantea]|uniref:Uncharacterized protein n=1 Tax=Carnegiea gigantea TaxID=171969 RepID=A0A9Q1JZU9_9CARY|nr:hypothetical protein Cgig2_028164 [Carnegiea gigantea]